MKIAAINIATGKYINLFEKSKNYISKNFFPSHDVDLFLFTASDREFTDSRLEIKKYYIKRRGFPADTLFRYHYFLKAEEELRKYDYIYYIDVDMNVVGIVNDDAFGDLVATYHPGFYKRNSATFETRKQSKAYVSPSSDQSYFCGGFQGGTPENYLKASKEISKNINIDGKNKIIAIWHDESHWNAYLKKTPPTLTLDPSYCYPEERYSWLKEFEETKKIMAMIKDEKTLRSN